MPSSDEDAPSVVFQRRSRKRKGSARTEVEGTQRTGPRVKPEEVSLSQEGQTSKIGRLTRHLIDATVNEKDGALKDVVTQKALYLSKKDYPSALKQASSALEKSFGCKVVHRSNQSYIVRMNHEQDHILNPMAQAKRGLLSAILMFIFASKSKKTNVNAVTETVLIKFLKSLGLHYDTPDPFFGDVKKLISPTNTAEFIHEGYISFAKSSDPSETQVISYDWGPRATLVCEPEIMLNSFCRIMRDPLVDKWSSQVKTMKQLEEEREQITKDSDRYMLESK